MPFSPVAGGSVPHPAKERMPAGAAAVIIPGMASFVRGLRLPAFAALAFALAGATPACAEGVEPRSLPWLLSRSDLVIAGRVLRVSVGLFSHTHAATLRVDGLIKGRWNRRDLEIAWNDGEFAETGYTRDARVVVFAVLGKDSAAAQTAPGISCWPVEKVAIRGKTARAAEYAYPLELLTQVPKAALGETEIVEKSMNFRVKKRKQWILIDKALPPVKPLRLRPAARKPAPKAKSAPRAGKPPRASAK
jgi:hypothetical protein